MALRGGPRELEATGVNTADPFTIALISAIAGAVAGGLAGLGASLYTQHRENERAARSAGRAIYFELRDNLVKLRMARAGHDRARLSRVAFDSHLPQVNTWLNARTLQALTDSYNEARMYHDFVDRARPLNDHYIEHIRRYEKTVSDTLGWIEGRLFTAQERAIMNDQLQAWATGRPDMDSDPEEPGN